MVYNRKMKFIDKYLRMQSKSSGRSMQIQIFIKQGCNMNTYEHENLNRLKIAAPIDLGAAPGRKLSPEVEIDSQTTSKPAKIEKMRKSRKTRKNFRIH